MIDICEFKKPVRKTVDIYDVFRSFINQGLTKDLHDNEEICPVCRGLGLIIVNNPYGLSGDPDRSQRFPYKHQSITYCKNCYNGVVKLCQDCGRQIERGRTQCDCDLAEKRRQEQKNKEYAERMIAAEKHNTDALGSVYKAAFSDHYPYNEGCFFDWEDFFDYWDDTYEESDKRPEYVWAGEEIKMTLCASDIISMACEDLHEDAVDDIPDSATKEMQDFFDGWLKKYGVTSYYESSKHMIKIPWSTKEGKNHASQE